MSCTPVAATTPELALPGVAIYNKYNFLSPCGLVGICRYEACRLSLTFTPELTVPGVAICNICIDYFIAQWFGKCTKQMCLFGEFYSLILVLMVLTCNVAFPNNFYCAADFCINDNIQG